MMLEKILVVDDVQSILFAMKMYFKANGYDVDCAKDVEEAIALMSKNDYRLLITDLRLTGVDGTEGLELVAYARSRFPTMRTIILTAYGWPEIEEQAYAIGVDAFLRKPKRLPELAQAVGELLSRDKIEPSDSTIESKQFSHP